MDKPIKLTEVAQAACELREKAEHLEKVVTVALHLLPEQRPRLLRSASCTVERLATESEDLAILLFEPDEEAVHGG